MAELPYPPASGGAIRALGILKGLAAAGFQITLMTFSDKNQLDPGSIFHQLCKAVYLFPPPQRSKRKRIQDLLFSQKADIAQRLYQAEFAEKLQSLLGEQSFDIVQFEGIEVACYLPIVKQTKADQITVFDTFNAEASLQRVIYEIDRQVPSRWHMALYSLIQSQRIKQYEAYLCQLADLVLAVSQEDAAILSAFNPKQAIQVIPSGIHVQDYNAEDTQADLPHPAILFTGKMDYRPNVDAMLWFEAEIFPLVKNKVPDAHLIIVGQKPHTRIAHFAQNPDMIITGWVDDVKPYLRATDVYIAPLRMGSGTRLKLLEAMACSLNIVATDIAAAGLNEQARQSIWIAEDSKSFADRIIELIKNPDPETDLGALARETVLNHYDWDVIIPELLKTYQRRFGIG